MAIVNIMTDNRGEFFEVNVRGPFVYTGLGIIFKNHEEDLMISTLRSNGQ